MVSNHILIFSRKIKENVKILIVGQVMKTCQIPKCKKQATAIAGPTCKKSYYEVLHKTSRNI